MSSPSCKKPAGQRSMPSLLQYLTFFIFVGSAKGLIDKNGCSLSCGLQTISFPFRLRGDPSICGDLDHELICDDRNSTVLELFPGKRYYVANISYEDGALQVVDADLVSGQCRLPYRVPFWSMNGKYYLSSVDIWASFINCSSKIQDDVYRHVPCLSGNNNSFVYVTYGNEVSSLLPSCGFLSMVASSGFDMTGSDAHLFDSLKTGFSLSWDRPPARFERLKKCLKQVARRSYQETQWGSSILKWVFFPFTFTDDFMGCMRDYKDVDRIPQLYHNLALFCLLSLEIIIIQLAISTFFRLIIAPLTIYVFLAYTCWKMMVPIDNVEEFLRNQQTLTPSRYAYHDIIAMTRNFKEKLGQGGYGTVYKGELPGGNLVAVKMLGNSRCNGEEFINEVSTIGGIHHLNVVRLVGFCSEGSKRALVYEFMPNGSLDKYIFSSNQRFTKEKLNEIALGVARGIDYLHRGCDMRILHFDIKPYNILLDRDFNPKVADFGLAKMCPRDYSLVSMSATRGTIGYIAPELVSRSFGVISHKSDVYSFGMLLMEMAGGRRNVDQRAENSSEAYYPSWIYDRLVQSEVVEICEPFKIDDMERKLCKVGLWCIQMRPSERPSMSRVIEMLEADVDTLQMPPKPFLSPGHVSLRESRIDSYPSELSIISEDE